VLSLMGLALARAQDFLLEPPAPGGTSSDSLPPGGIEAVVLGLRSGSGASTLARGLAATLAVAGPRRTHLLAVGGSRNRTAPLGGGAFGGGSLWEVPAGLHDREEVAEYGSMVARLAGEHAALVWDVPSCAVERAAVVAARADVVLAVAPGSGEPAFAEVVSGMLAERFDRVVLVANNVTDPGRWSGRADVCVPGSRWGALLAGRGRRPPGAFGAALEELAALVEGMRRSPGSRNDRWDTGPAEGSRRPGP
jgi:hypothetical protein